MAAYIATGSLWLGKTSTITVSSRQPIATVPANHIPEQNHRITPVGKDLKGHQIQPQPAAPCPLTPIPQSKKGRSCSEQQYNKKGAPRIRASRAVHVLSRVLITPLPSLTARSQYLHLAQAVATTSVYFCSPKGLQVPNERSPCRTGCRWLRALSLLPIHHP